MPRKHTSPLDWISGILAVAVLAIVAFFLVSPLRAFLLVMAGRGTGCPLAKAVWTRSAMDAEAARQSRISNASRIIGEDASLGIDLWESPKGKYWLPKNQKDLLASLLAEQEENIYGSGDQAVRAGDVVLDCGAHIGVFSRVAIAAGAKLVIAIEPSPINLECLRRNMAPEISAGRVVVVAEGVWDKQGTLPFHMDPANSAGNSLLVGEKGLKPRPVTIEVPLTTIDKLAVRLKLERVDFIKMDIEGAETNALRGAKSTIATYRPRMAICTYHTRTDAAQVPIVARSARSDYRTQCGPCEEQDFRIIPQVMLFY
jgi:FkbM family methyltransferase